ncbi:Uncharacterized protein TCM_003861 [Theobroma cacao]|uniref:Uncharacterized protein n=1 Tax=Theobroma cacao TaxID=3641 RepID=A0A061DQC0_THECC|nr:Uncharacterized protein TCM_003861 [Theobroma cacao]
MGYERNWSTFDYVHSKKRNCLEQQRLNVLIFVQYNIQLELRQSKRIKKCETYNPICFSDMESNNEWITEMEDPCLPQENSWMECFEDEGLRLAKKKAWNLQFDAKRKSKIILQNEDIQSIGEEEENLQDKEEEDMVVLKEDEGSHDDNDLELEDDDNDLAFGDE